LEVVSLFRPNWRILWIGSLVLAALCGFAYGWRQRSENPPFIITTKSKEPPEMKLLRKGRYDEAAQAVLDSIKDEKKDYFRFNSVAAVYFARAARDRSNREKWVAQAAFYIDKGATAAPNDPLNLMVAASGMDRIGDGSNQSCPYYEKARRFAQGAMSQLKGDSIFVGDEKTPTQPIRDEIAKLLSRLQSKIEAKCTSNP
jgi:hypothetical protein